MPSNGDSKHTFAGHKHASSGHAHSRRRRNEHFADDGSWKLRLISRSATTVAIMAGSVSNPPIVSRVNLTHLTRAQFDPFTRRRGGKPFYFIRTRKSHRGFTKGEIWGFFPPSHSSLVAEGSWIGSSTGSLELKGALVVKV